MQESEISPEAAKWDQKKIEKLIQSPVVKALFRIRGRARLIHTLKKLLTDTNGLRQAIHIDAFNDYLRRISHQEVFNAFSVFDDIPVNGGRAIAPAHAANVLTDATRTCTFIRGLHDAITELKQRFSDERPLRILYAGTGPFAALALPSMAVFPPKDVQFDLLEIQDISLRNARRVLEICGFKPHCGHFWEEDATEFKPNRRYHAIITETMGPALGEEPQIKIMENLQGALIEGGIMIPEEIRLGLMLFKNTTDERRFPGLWVWPPRNGETSDRITMTCPFEFREREEVVVASYAELDVFGENRLTLGDCLLSDPIHLGIIQKESGKEQETLVVAYKPGSNLVYGERVDQMELK